MSASISRALIGAGCSLAVALAAGCAPVAPAVTARDVMLERERSIEAESRGLFTEFLAENASRLEELELPRPAFQGVVERERWGESVIECVESLDTDIQVSRQEGGFGVNYFGVPDETFERIRWTIESCMAQYGVPAATPAPPGPIEREWMHHDENYRLAPCWRSLGYSTPPPPSAAALRAEPLCPSTAAELQRQLDIAAGER